MNAGSQYFIEIGHNGNGNIEATDDQDDSGEVCIPGPIEYDEQIDTPLEFAKPPGTGTNIWPATSNTYPNYTMECLEGDALMEWFAKSANLNAFAHVSHTFTHEDQNNATYSDVYKELTWNQGWLAATGISKATRFSSKGLIPPAITGLHNADALKAWRDCGIVHAYDSSLVNLVSWQHIRRNANQVIELGTTRVLFCSTKYICSQFLVFFILIDSTGQ